MFWWIFTSVSSLCLHIDHFNFSTSFPLLDTRFSFVFCYFWWCNRLLQASWHHSTQSFCYSHEFGSGFWLSIAKMSWLCSSVTGDSTEHLQPENGIIWKFLHSHMWIPSYLGLPNVVPQRLTVPNRGFTWFGLPRSMAASGKTSSTVTQNSKSKYFQQTKQEFHNIL